MLDCIQKVEEAMQVGDLVRLSDGQTIGLITDIKKRGTCLVTTTRGHVFALVAAQIKEVISGV